MPFGWWRPRTPSARPAPRKCAFCETIGLFRVRIKGWEIYTCGTHIDSALDFYNDIQARKEQR